MASITERTLKDGSTVYLAQIYVKKKGFPPYRESRSFDRRPAAAAWAKKRTQEIQSAPDPTTFRKRAVTLSDAIDTYVNQTMRQIGRTKAQVLRTIKDYDIASMPCDQIRSHDIVEFAQELSFSREPSTVGNYLSHLSAIFAIAKPAWGIPLDQSAMRDALAVTKRLGVTSKSKSRDRRPTLSELDQLMELFQMKHASRPGSVPMHCVVAFSIFSTRRQDEITRITWKDLDPGQKRIMVRDMKHPGDKEGNDVLCDPPDPALAVIEAMPRRDDRIFPYSADAVSAAFTRACKALQIQDLHFHDLRHDGVSRVFEMGYSIPAAAMVSGHRSWSSLQRYTHLNQIGDKYEARRWINEVTKPMC